MIQTRLAGLEPAIIPNALLRGNFESLEAFLAGLEPAIYGLEDRCIIQLCYRNLGVATLSTELQAQTRWTGLEPATTGSTGRYSDQLNYHPNTSGGTRTRT